MTLPPRVDQVTAYLAARGWRVSGRWRNASVWSQSEFEVLVPPADTIADAAPRLRELVQCVADAEGRSPQAIWLDMTTPDFDIVSYRTQDHSSTFTLPMGAGLLVAVQDLIAISARESLGDNRTTLQGRPPEAVRLLLERSLLSLSQETVGLDIRLPFDNDPAPLGRRTALRVMHSSMAVLQAARSTDEDAFQHVLQQGISEAVCTALAGLAGPDHTAAFELGFRWSHLAPLDDTTVQFPGEAGALILARSRNADPAPSGTGVVEGLVTSLSDDESGDRWRIKVRGILTVNDSESERRRQLVAVRLANDADYASALAAHRDGRIVRASGALTRTRRTSEITSTAKGFAAIDQPEP
ncbi:hypothetical protein [Nocardia altamirensis]|uniref:hypothetical protein n=1 Tax=Nocardia altamirensis TaxID=472158 RepID=UPI0008403516|nr:hypothetical protein [Nocardia altamirensis]